MEGILRDVPGTVVYIDDVLVTGKTQEEHLKNLDLVLSRLEEEGLSLKREKCSFMLSRVEYLGHVILADGRQPSKEKIRAIMDITSTSEYCPIKVILRNNKLLWQIPGAFIESASTTVSITATEDTLALRCGRENNLQSS